ncbi:MAG: CPBP family intramembrane glutamic endopeptidase [Saprospiraceae bacterium]
MGAVFPSTTLGRRGTDAHFLQNQIDRFFGNQIALLATAIVFGAMHIDNEGFTWVAGLQIVTGGYLMGQLYASAGNVWAPYAFHAVWNFVQSVVLGFAVSGVGTYRILQLSTHGPDWLTGGSFGLEGSILTLLGILIVIGWLWSSQTEHCLHLEKSSIRTDDA